MTDYPSNPEKRLQLFIDECRQRGLKLTHQRLEIYKVLAATQKHPSAEEIHKMLVPSLPTLSLDTVYRTLLTFDRHGLITRVEVLDDRARFDANLKVHHHMVCKKCRKTVDFYWPVIDDLETPAETEGWGRIESRHLELRGICQSCLKKD